MQLTRVTGVLLAVVFAAAGCSSNGAGDDLDSGKLRVSYVAFTGAAPTLIGIEKGIFKKHGLELEHEAAPSPATIISSLESGEIEVGMTTLVTAMTAIEQGLDIKCIASFDGLGDPDPNTKVTGLMVPPNSGIESPAELEGKKVAVVALGSLDYLFGLDSISRAGGDPKKVEFVQLPFPQHIEALEAGRVDAAITTEPFTSQALKKGNKGLDWEEQTMLANKNSKCYAATGEFIKEHPELVANFIDAMDESLDYAGTHTAEALATLPSILDVTPEQAAESQIGFIWKGGFNMDGVQELQDLMIEQGLLENEIPLDRVILDPDSL